MKTDFSKDGMESLMSELIVSARERLQIDGFIAPIIFLLKDNNGTLLIAPEMTDYRDELRKVATTIAMKLKMAMEKTDAYIMITEAWMAVLESGQVIRHRPSNDPDANEGIVVACGTPLLSLSLTQVFHRAENGNGPKFEFEEEIFAERTESIFYPEHWRNKN